MADVQTTEMEATLAPVTWDTDTSSKDEELLVRPFLSKTKNTNMAAS
jgi:hypothetical protein